MKMSSGHRHRLVDTKASWDCQWVFNINSNCNSNTKVDKKWQKSPKKPGFMTLCWGAAYILIGSGTDADSFAFQVPYIKPLWVSAWCQVGNLVHQTETRAITKHHHLKSQAWEQADNICAWPSIMLLSCICASLRKNTMSSDVFFPLNHQLISMFDKGPLTAFLATQKELYLTNLQYVY